MSDLLQPWRAIDEWFARRLPRLRERFWDHVGERYQGQTYMGHGNIDMRRGWLFRGQVVWLDEEWS